MANKKLDKLKKPKKIMLVIDTGDKVKSLIYETKTVKFYDDCIAAVIDGEGIAELSEVQRDKLPKHLKELFKGV